MKKLFKVIFILVIICLVIIVYLRKVQFASIIEYKSNLDSNDYPKTLDSIKTRKHNLNDKQYGNIGKEFTLLLTTKIFPYWYGTNWDFYGTTEKPNEGSIACGYFVTTTLRDIGLPINRTKLAQYASEDMIKQIVSKDNIYRFSKKSIAEFERSLERKGNAIYIVGLDNHTGFLLFSNEGNFFIHSSGSFPYSVIKEKLAESRILKKSKYRVAGNLSADKDLLLKWIKN